MSNEINQDLLRIARYFVEWVDGVWGSAATGTQGGCMRLSEAILLGDSLKKVDFDPCPFPKPEDFDGLTCEWGSSNYVNPPFGSILHEGRKKGPTAWARKAIAEAEKGKRVVLVYPIDKWVLMLLKAGAQVRNLGDVRWHSTEDGQPGKGTGRHIAAFILGGALGNEG
jgi:hypothetical protein